MKANKSHIYRGIASVFLALMILTGLLGNIADSWSDKVNELMGVTDNSFTRSSDPKDYRFTSDYANGSELIQAEIDLNTRLAAEGSVVLKGLPALNGTRVTLFGMRSGENMQFGGSMGELIHASNVVTLSEAMAKNGFSVNPDMERFYQEKAADYAPTRSAGGNIISSYDDQGSTIGEVPVSEYNAALIGDYKDAAVVVFGRDAGESACFYPGINGLSDPEEFSQSPTGNILSLSNDERDLLNWVKGQGFTKIVVLLNSATAMEIEELKNDSAVDSIIWIGNPGAYGTYGIAKLLSGEMLPSGHLSDTFAVNSALSPAAQNYGVYAFSNPDEIETTTNHALRAEWYLVEAESIYVGYKYYETRYFDSIMNQGNASAAKSGESTTGAVWNYDSEVSYTFGYGVEGSTFSEEILAADIDWTGENESTVTVRVTNTGNVAAKHSVQLYVSAPYTLRDRENGIEKSAVQLLAYAKTGEASEKTFRDVVLLQPGTSEDVTLCFNAQDFYSYDMTYEHDGVCGAWSLEAGDYYFATGNGAHEAVNAVLNAMNGTSLATTGAAIKETRDNDFYITHSNDTIVQNRLDSANLNTYHTDATVTYLTRNDWANSFPRSIDSITATSEMIYILQNVSYNAELENSLYTGAAEFTYGANTGRKAVELIGKDYDDPLYETIISQMTLSELIDQYLAILNELDSISMPKEAPSDSPVGIIGYIGQRTSGSIYEVSADDPAYKHNTNVYVGSPTVAATFSPLLQYEMGRLVANDCLWTGYTTWFGPGMNLHRTPYNMRNIAYYSEDSVLTGLASAYVHTALNKYGIVTNTKHFAFNDQETNRDGLAVFLSEQAGRENELRGYQIAIRDGGMKGLMTAFNRIGLQHVAAHKGIMNGILQGEWGFCGMILTDSVKSAQYFLPRETLMAGNNMMLGGSNNGNVWNFTVDAVSKDPALQSALRESYHHKLYVYVNSVLLNGITAESASTGAVVWWVLMFRIFTGLFLVGFITFGTMYIVKKSKSKKEARQ